MSFTQVQVGPQILSDGTIATARAGKLGDLIVSELNGRYYENSYRNNTFYAVNSAAQALSLNSATTYTGLTLANPAASGKNFVLLEAIWGATISPTAAGAIVIVTGSTTTQTTGSSIGPASNLLGSGTASVAKIGASCTYAATPAIVRPLLGIPWISAAGNGSGGLQEKDEVAGALIVPPGQQISFVAVTTAITGIGMFTWAELSI